MHARAHSQPGPMRRVRPVERQPMKEWITDLLDSGAVSSLSWTDKSKREFKIKWCHGSRHGWSIKDADLFERWARHTGRYFFGGKKDPKRWKANFRCALNSLKTIEEVRDKSHLKGSNACRIYRMTDVAKKEPKLQKEIRQATKTGGKQTTFKDTVYNPVVKHEEIPTDEEMTSDSETTEDLELVYDHGLQTHDNTHFTQTKSEKDSVLPNFDKISPGIDKIEFGRMHCLPRHSCGFMVQMGTSKPTTETTSPISNVKISLSDSFQRQISGSGSTSQASCDSRGAEYKPVIFPESPEASDASPQSAAQEEEMVEVNLYEVSQEVTVTSSNTEDSPFMLANLHQWQPTEEQYQTVSAIFDIINSGQMQQQTHSTCDWTQGYSPLTPP